jgi:hypothetical protein
VVVAGGALALALGRRWSLRDGRGASSPATPRRADNLLETAHGRDVELRPTPVDPHGPVFRLNRSAALIWRSVDGRRTVDELAAVLGAAFGLSAAAARADTRECLQTLSGAGLVFGVSRADDASQGQRS